VSQNAASASATAASSSQTNSATNATNAGNSATAANLSAVAAAASALVAGGETLASISKSIHYGAIVKSIIYDTSKDSDGGAWRKRCTDKSWYTESLGFTGTWGGQAANVAAGWAACGSVTGGAYQNTTDGKFYTPTSSTTQTEIFRGNVREFPEQVAIVAESARVVIYDLTQVGTPMWMVFANTGLWTFCGYQPSVRSLSSVSAMNGKLVSGGSSSGNMTVCDFIADSGLTYLSTGSGLYSINGKIASRTSALTSTSISISTAIVNNTVNDVALTVLDSAPIDPATGLPVPTIAVATAGGVSVIKDDGTVVNSTSVAVAINSVAFRKGTTTILATRDTAATSILYLIASPYSSHTQYDPITAPFGFAAVSGAKLIGATSMPTAVAAGFVSGVQVFKENPTTPTKGMVSYITNAYNSGWLPGDIRGAYLADTTAETITASGELVTNGTFTTDTTGWTVGASATIAATGAELNITNTGATFGNASQGFTTVIGKTYIASCNARIGTASLVNLSVGTALGNSAIGNASTNSGTNVTLQVTFVAIATTTYVSAVNNNTSAGTGIYDNISVKLADPDRSVKNTGLVLNGSLTKTAVASGAGLVAYSGFSAANYLEQPYSSQLDFGTGDFCVMGWCYVTAGDQPLVFRAVDASVTNPTNGINLWASSGTQIKSWINGTALNTAAGVTNASAWNFICVFRSGATVYIYTNGVLATSGANSGSITLANAKLQLGVGFYTNFSQQMALWRISATAPSADQIAHIYRTELPLFQASAQCTIAGTSTAVTALAYDDVADTLHVGTSWGRTAFRDLLRVDSEATTTGALTSLSANEGAVVTGGATSGRFYQPAMLLRDELRRKDVARKALGRVVVGLDFIATSGQTAFVCTKGYDVRFVYSNGLLKRITTDYTVSDDGFQKTVTFTSGVVLSTPVTIMMTRS
jgi:hypothetical protein